MITDRGYGIFTLPQHCQSRVKFGLTHPIENRCDALVPIVLRSRCENDTKAIGTRWLSCLHMPRSNVLALRGPKHYVGKGGRNLDGAL